MPRVFVRTPYYTLTYFMFFQKAIIIPRARYCNVCDFTVLYISEDTTLKGPHK